MPHTGGKILLQNLWMEFFCLVLAYIQTMVDYYYYYYYYVDDDDDDDEDDDDENNNNNNNNNNNKLCGADSFSNVVTSSAGLENSCLHFTNTCRVSEAQAS